MLKSRIFVYIILSTAAIMFSAMRGQAKPDIPELRTEFATTITVDSGQDFDTAGEKSCADNTPCTLRRAIVQAGSLPQEERPVQIRFDIPAKEAEGYDEALQVWRLELLSSDETAALPAILGGRITIDGTTQPGGREDGPPIILVGPGAGLKDGMVVGDGTTFIHDQNEVIGLGLQNFKNHVTLNSSQNQIRNSWFGLAEDGLAPYLRGGDAVEGSGETGIANNGSSSNLVLQDVFLGLRDYAVTLEGQDNGVAGNFVGTNARGETPMGAFGLTAGCGSGDWLGGGGIYVAGSTSSIFDNTFATLRRETTDEQPFAITVVGSGHLIEDNIVGEDVMQNASGVCGGGILLQDGPQGVQVINNRIVNSKLSAIALRGALYDANTLRSNVIWQDTAWSGGAEAIQMGAGLPAALRNFKPAQILAIDGLTVTGTSGDASRCPNCRVELFLDDLDGIAEAIQPLAETIADENGDWAADLPAALGNQQGLRTISTSLNDNVIPDLAAGTSTGLSRLYRGDGTAEFNLLLPLILNGS